MGEYRVSQHVDAPVERVFDTVAHIDRYREVIPHIVDVEVLSDTTRGVGTRFRETRLIRGRRATTELEVTEYEPNEWVRLVSDAGGTIWDTVFTTTPEGEGTRVDLVMTSSPYRLGARVSVPLIGSMLRKALQADLDALKEHLEAE